MYRDSESQTKFYRIKCADWEYMVLAENMEDAASSALKKVMDLKGENAKLSFSMCIDEISDQDIYTDFMYVPKVLEDIGLFKLSNELSSLSDFFLDKGKNSH